MASNPTTTERAPARPRVSQAPRLLALATVLLVLAVAFVGTRSRRAPSVTSAPVAASGDASPEAVIPVLAAVVQTGTLTETLRVTGSLRTDANVVLSSKLAGKVVLLQVKEGDTVRAGQLVARIDDSEQQAQRQRAGAAVRVAEAKLSQTAVSGTVKNTGAAAEYTRARAATAAARARLAQVEHSAQIQDTLAETRVRTAQAGLQSARERLRMLQQGSRRQELRMAEQSVQRAKIDLDNAERNYRRREQLLKEGAISQEDSDEARRRFEQAQVQLADAEEQRSMTQEGPRTEEVRMAEQQVTQSEQSLTDAEANRAQRQISQEEVTASREAVHQAEAAERSARAALVQDRLTREDVRSAAATVQQARADVAYYDTLIQQTRIVAPVSGTITNKYVNQGEFVAAGARLLGLVSRESLYLEAVASERQLERLRPGQPAQVRVDVRPGQVYQGVVREILPLAEGLTRSSRVRISLRGGQDLPVGAFARAIIPVGRRSGVVVISDAAVQSEAGVNYVFTIVTNRAKRRTVELGTRDRDRVEITAGLRPGDRIITGGSPAVVDGAAVRAR